MTNMTKSLDLDLSGHGRGIFSNARKVQEVQA